MKFDNLSESLAILTNASVLVGLIFLIIEIRQNNEFLEFEKETRSIAELTDSAALLWNDETLSAALFTEPSARTAEQTWRITSAVRLNFNAMERAWLQGYFQSSPGIAARYKSAFNANDPRGELLRSTWASHKAVLEHNFVEWFETNVTNET